MGDDGSEKMKAAKGKPDPQRMAILRSLPLEVKEKITGEEAQAFLYLEEVPESLMEKLRDYMVEDGE